MCADLCQWLGECSNKYESRSGEMKEEVRQKNGGRKEEKATERKEKDKDAIIIHINFFIPLLNKIPRVIRIQLHAYFKRKPWRQTARLIMHLFRYVKWIKPAMNIMEYKLPPVLQTSFVYMPRALLCIDVDQLMPMRCPWHRIQSILRMINPWKMLCANSTRNDTNVRKD